MISSVSMKCITSAAMAANNGDDTCVVVLRKGRVQVASFASTPCGCVNSPELVVAGNESALSVDFPYKHR